jgi:hypothetical protein
MPRGKKQNLPAQVTESTTALVQVPDYIAKGTARGADHLKTSDMAWPFLRLAQDKTPGVGEPGKHKIGDYFNSLTGQVYGPEVAIIVVLATVGQMKFGKFGSGDGIQCQSVDGLKALAHNGLDKAGKATNDCLSCVHAQWGEEHKGKQAPPTCTKQARYLVMAGAAMDPAIFVLQRTSFPAARKLNSIIKQSGLDCFALAFKLRSKKTDTAMVTEVEAAGYSPKTGYQKGEALFNQMAKAFFGHRIDTPDAAE